MKYRSKSPKDTQKLAEQIIKKNPDVKIFFLYGDLASGKTTFVKGLADQFGLEQSKIKSPTFTFISDYGSAVHCDLYRLEVLDEGLVDTIEEHLESKKILFIEWPEVLQQKQLHKKYKTMGIRFLHVGENLREIELEDYSSSLAM